MMVKNYFLTISAGLLFVASACAAEMMPAHQIPDALTECMIQGDWQSAEFLLNSISLSQEQLQQVLCFIAYVRLQRASALKRLQEGSSAEQQLLRIGLVAGALSVLSGVYCCGRSAWESGFFGVMTTHFRPSLAVWLGSFVAMLACLGYSVSAFLERGKRITGIDHDIAYGFEFENKVARKIEELQAGAEE